MGQCGDAAAAMESARPGGDGSAAAARAALRAAANPARSRALRRFFKTGKGEYAEGDRFLGLTVPQLRALAQRFRGLPLPGLASMLGSPYHEERLLALLILVDRFHGAGSEAERERLLRFYLRHLRGVDNWDLVDLSAEHILGPYAATSAAGVVERLSRSPRVWDRRVAVLAHFHDIKRGRGDAFLRFAPRFFEDDHDLIHKAVGWMLREVGKRSGVRALERFLDRHARDAAHDAALRHRAAARAPPSGLLGRGRGPLRRAGQEPPLRPAGGRRRPRLQVPSPALTQRRRRRTRVGDHHGARGWSR